MLVLRLDFSCGVRSLNRVLSFEAMSENAFVTDAFFETKEAMESAVIAFFRSAMDGSEFIGASIPAWEATQPAAW